MIRIRVSTPPTLSASFDSLRKATDGLRSAPPAFICPLALQPPYGAPAKGPRISPNSWHASRINLSSSEPLQSQMAWPPLWRRRFGRERSIIQESEASLSLFVLNGHNTYSTKG